MADPQQLEDLLVDVPWPMAGLVLQWTQPWR